MGIKSFNYYDGEVVYTSISKGSKIRILEDAVRFTDYKEW